MNPLTLEWVEKAEEDYNVALREYRARKSPAYNAACFHAQQCAEKYLKARLQEAAIGFPRTHSLPALLQLVLVAEPLVGVVRPAEPTYGLRSQLPLSRRERNEGGGQTSSC